MVDMDVAIESVGGEEEEDQEEEEQEEEEQRQVGVGQRQRKVCVGGGTVSWYYCQSVNS